jgi:hypothetical protein
MLPLLLSGLPGCHQVVIFPFLIGADFKDNGAQQTASSPDGAELARIVPPLVQYVRLVENFLSFLQADPVLSFDIAVFSAFELDA